MNPDHFDSLEEQVDELRSRVRRLEEALLSNGILELQAEAPPAPPPPVAAPSLPPVVMEQESPQQFEQPAYQPPPPGFAGFTAPADGPSLESRIGSQWFNRVGILAVLIAMAWFLKLAIDNHWIGPLGRVLIGLVAGAALIAWSERFRNHGYAAFSY
jgi:uncharacterized membrane protein